MKRKYLEIDLEEDIEENLVRLQAQVDALMSLPHAARLSVANVTPTSVIVVESDEELSAEQRENIKSGLSLLWPDNKVVVCVRGLRLKISEAPKA